MLWSSAAALGKSPGWPPGAEGRSVSFDSVSVLILRCPLLSGWDSTQSQEVLCCVSALRSQHLLLLAQGSRFEERIAGIVRTKSGSDSDSSCGSSSSVSKQFLDLLRSTIMQCSC